MTTILLPSAGLTKLLREKTLFVDTNVFIGASRSDDLTRFLLAIRDKLRTEILTVSSVVHEYTRGAKSLDDFNDRRQFIAGLVQRIIPIGKLLEDQKNDVFSAVMSLFVKKQDSDYTDFLLATCLYRYSMVQDVYLMTADQRSMPPQIFTLKGALTIADREGHIHNLGVYCIDHGNFAKVARKLEQPR